MAILKLVASVPSCSQTLPGWLLVVLAFCLSCLQTYRFLTFLALSFPNLPSYQLGVCPCACACAWKAPSGFQTDVWRGDLGTSNCHNCQGHLTMGTWRRLPLHCLRDIWKEEREVRSPASFPLRPFRLSEWFASGGPEVGATEAGRQET